jgi:hypothetical protein
LDADPAPQLKAGVLLELRFFVMTDFFVKLRGRAAAAQRSAAYKPR